MVQSFATRERLKRLSLGKGQLSAIREREVLAEFNYLSGLDSLSNRYFVLRHGESQANKVGIITCRRESGLQNYGLTPRGTEEIINTTGALRRFVPGQDVVIITSPFLRAVESARIAAGLLNSPVKEDERLSERDFGELELKSAENYIDVWAEDLTNPLHRKWQVESPVAVLQRATSLVRDIEAAHSSQNFLFVTHGDVAMILGCGFLNISPAFHRQLDVMETAEVREFVLQPSRAHDPAFRT